MANGISGTQRNAYLFLAIFLAIDLSFIFFHALYFLSSSFIETPSLLLDTKEGLPELFQFLKYSLILTIIVKYVFIYNWKSYLALFLIFLTLFLDDVFQLHMLAAAKINNALHFDYKWGLRGPDFGYLLYTFLLGFLVIVVALFGYLKSAKALRNGYSYIILLMCIFLFFGVGMDLLNRIFTNRLGAYFVFTIIEEGGEMISLSMLVWYFYRVGLVHAKDLIPKY